MRTNDIRVHGIYDLATIEVLKEQKVSHWAFDFRPRSLNFIQAYKLEEILYKEGMHADSVTLHFSNEKDFVVKKVITDLMKAYPQIKGRLFLEFSDTQSVFYYESFGLPFYTHYMSDRLSQDFLSSPFLKGLILGSDLLDEILANELERNFLMNLFSYNPKMLARPIDFVLNTTQNTVFYRSFFEFLDFKVVSLVLGPELEINYRHINFDLLRHKLSNLLQKEKYHAHSSFQ